MINVPNITLIELQDGTHAFEVEGIRKHCIYPISPILSSQGLITPSKQCTTACAHCNIDFTKNDKIEVGCVIRITCQQPVNHVVMNIRKEMIQKIT